MLSSLLLAGVVAMGVGGQKPTTKPSAGIVRQAPPACVPVEQECVRVACEDECWEVRVSYDSAEGPQQAITGGKWGSISGALCQADKVSAQGFWLTPDVALQPTKVPPGALRLVVIDRASP